MLDNDVFLLVWLLILLFYLRFLTKQDKASHAPSVKEAGTQQVPLGDKASKLYLMHKVCEVELKHPRKKLGHCKCKDSEWPLLGQTCTSDFFMEPVLPKPGKSKVQAKKMGPQSNNRCKRNAAVLFNSLQLELAKTEEKNEVDLKDCKLLCQGIFKEEAVSAEKLGFSSKSFSRGSAKNCPETKDSALLLSGPPIGMGLEMRYSEIGHENEKVSSRENALLDFLNQNSWAEAEMTKLKEENHELEEALHECDERVKLLEMVRVLLEDNRKLERDRSRESANMEYIKNVVLKFLLSESHSVRQQLTTAIGSILLFSPSELSQVKRVQRNALWQS